MAAPTGTAARVASTERVTGRTLHFLLNIRTRSRPSEAAPFEIPTGNTGGEDEQQTAIQLNSDETELAPDDEQDEVGIPTAILDRHTLERLRAMRLLILDEISMVSSELLDMLDCCMRYARSCNRPFGGCVVMVVGDFFQLAPILSAAAIARAKGRGWAFQSLVWPHFRPVQLVQLVRQQGDTRFAEVLNRMRVGASTWADAVWLNLQGNAGTRMPAQTLAIFPSNSKCAVRNVSMIKALDGPDILLEPSYSCVQLVSARPWRVAPAAPPAGRQVRYHPQGTSTITLRIGCRVRATRNVYTGNYPYRELEIANGQRGTVTDTDFENPATQTITVCWDAIGTLPAMEMAVARVTWSRRQSFRAHNLNPQGNPVFALSRQFPLTVAYALTVHSGQGMSVDHGVDIDHKVVEPKKEGGWGPKAGGAYVAISRATTMQNVNLLQRFVPSDAVANDTVASYYGQAFGAVAQ